MKNLLFYPYGQEFKLTQGFSKSKCNAPPKKIKCPLNELKAQQATQIPQNLQTHKFKIDFSIGSAKSNQEKPQKYSSLSSAPR